MQVLKSTASQYLVALREYFKYTQKAKTAKTLSKELSIPIDFVEKYLATLASTDYFKCELSSTGRLKRAWFNKYSTRIYYKDYCCGIEKGRITVGNPRSLRSLDNYDKRHVEEFEDRARKDGLICVSSAFSDEAFVEVFIKEMRLTLLDQTATSKAEEVDEFEAYPLVKVKIQEYTSLIEKLEKEVEDEIALNKKNADWYATEYQKASWGQRRKDEAYTVVVGEERIVGVTYNKYWFDDEPTREYTEKFVPKYETRYRSVVDWPEKPKEHTEKQYKNKDLIRDYKIQLKHYSDNRIRCEKRLQEEKQRMEAVAELEKQKKEIERKIRQLR